MARSLISSLLRRNKYSNVRWYPFPWTSDLKFPAPGHNKHTLFNTCTLGPLMCVGGALLNDALPHTHTPQSQETVLCCSSYFASPPIFLKGGTGMEKWVGGGGGGDERWTEKKKRISMQLRLSTWKKGILDDEKRQGWQERGNTCPGSPQHSN